MATSWYNTHFEAAGYAGDADTERTTLELWESVAAGGRDPARLAELAAPAPGARSAAERGDPPRRRPWRARACPGTPSSRATPAPVESSLPRAARAARRREALRNHGFDFRLGAFAGGAPAPSCGALFDALAAVGGGANPMPFPKPAFLGCELRHRQAVATGRGDVTMEHVLVTADGRGFGLVRNLQTCIYGKVRHGVELEPTGAAAARGGIFGLGSAGGAPWRATEREVAIKCIERAKYEQHMARHAGRLNEDPIKEVAVMNYVASAGGARYVLPMLGCYADEASVYVVMPFCPHGDLFGVVESRGALEEARAAAYMGQIVAGLEKLHALGLAHHDMSLENLMLDANEDAIIIDFGMAVKSHPTFTRFLAGADAPPPPPPGHERDLAAGPSYYAAPWGRQGWPCRCGKLLYMAPELFEAKEPFDVFAADLKAHPWWQANARFVNVPV
ncbi:serine/threonine kinase [Aureococcus anophagefferens]|nr:serine/threonine kinase [Aureococcus anophagefferens]